MFLPSLAFVRERQPILAPKGRTAREVPILLPFPLVKPVREAFLIGSDAGVLGTSGRQQKRSHTLHRPRLSMGVMARVVPHHCTD